MDACRFYVSRTTATRWISDFLIARCYRRFLPIEPDLAAARRERPAFVKTGERKKSHTFARGIESLRSRTVCNTREFSLKRAARCRLREPPGACCRYVCVLERLHASPVTEIDDWLSHPLNANLCEWGLVPANGSFRKGSRKLAVV